MIAFLLLVEISFLFSETSGYSRYRYECPSTKFTCASGGCIFKHQWCDGSRDCDVDESYCNVRGVYNRYDCDANYFKCSNGMCIPKNGKCDGYISCPDGSDEQDCPCPTVVSKNEGVIDRTISMEEYETKHMCWKFITTSERYLNLSIAAILHPRQSCNQGNITIVTTSYGHSNSARSVNKHTICSTSPAHVVLPITTIGEVKILYLSNLYSSEPKTDFFDISYNTVDRECLNPDSFECSKNSCIMLEKLCDGIDDCENGTDEENCGIASYVKRKFQGNLKNVSNWMRSQRDADWGWKENTGRAVVALHLSNGLDFKTNPKEDDLIAKQLELEVSTHLLRTNISKISPTELSTYINALLVICHDPENFFGFDLIQKLKKEIKDQSNYMAPLPYLTLCNAKERVSSEEVGHLLQIIEKSSDNGFILELQALALMALSCISKDDQYAYLTKNITEGLNNLKLEQREDGSFGNEYTTSLVLQAFIAYNQTDENDWSFKSSIEFLQQKQETDGSFGDFLTTYLAMPIFNMKSLVDVGKVNCTQNLRRPREGNLISDIKSRLVGKIPVKYSLFVGDKKDQIHPIFLRVPENITAFEVMSLAADIDPKYKFKTHEIKKKKYVYEVINIPNDPENNKFWFLYHDVENKILPVSTQAPDEVHVHEDDHIIMWYRTLNTLYIGENE